MAKRNNLEMKTPINKLAIREFLGSTRFLTFGLWTIGGIILFIGAILLDPMVTDSNQDLYIGLLLLVVMPWFIVGSVFVILRGEMPQLGLPSIKGRSAVIQGVVGVLGFSLIEIGIIYFVLTLL